MSVTSIASPRGVLNSRTSCWGEENKSKLLKNNRGLHTSKRFPRFTPTEHSYRNLVCSGSRAYAQQGRGPPAQVMERFQGVASQLMTQRIIRLGGAVDDDGCNLIVAQLLWLDSIDPRKDITLYINSPGGSVTAGMAVFDTMRHIRPHVSTVCVGLAASMGAFLLASGQQGKRFSLPNSRIMIHQPLGGAQGQAADIEIQANEIMHHKSTLNGYLAEFTNKPLEQVMEDTDRDFFMSAEDAVSYGLIDAIIDHPTNVAVSTSGIKMYTSDP